MAITNTFKNRAAAYARYCFWSVLLLALLGGCSFKVKLVGEYDEITDQAVMNLHKKTASFFAKLKSAAGSDASYDANKNFYEDALGDVAALTLRSKVTEVGLKHTPLTRNFEDLRLQYEDLAVLHKTSPDLKIIASAAAAFEQSFRAILENLLYLKWNQAQPDAKQ